MLKDMDMHAKKHFFHKINGRSSSDSPTDSVVFETAPERDGHLPWPTFDDYKTWWDNGYMPMVFVLGPGEYLHIGHGRIHMFRNMAADPLPPTDCHYHLRKKTIEQNRLARQSTLPSSMCVSFAHDLYVCWGRMLVVSLFLCLM